MINVIKALCNGARAYARKVMRRRDQLYMYKNAKVLFCFLQLARLSHLLPKRPHSTHSRAGAHSHPALNKIKLKGFGALLFAAPPGLVCRMWVRMTETTLCVTVSEHHHHPRRRRKPQQQQRLHVCGANLHYAAAGCHHGSSSADAHYMLVERNCNIRIEIGQRYSCSMRQARFFFNLDGFGNQNSR